MTAKKLLVVGLILVLLAILANSYFGYRSYSRLCGDHKKLAKIERTLLTGQSIQTKALLKKGFTFGLPKGELPILVKKSEDLQRQFLTELDELANDNCSI